MAEEDLSRLRAVVHGWVQGVGYRDFVMREGRRLGLNGYVRNSSDGSVEIEAEGPVGDLQQLLARLREGPSLAEVRNVDVAWDAPRGDLHSFELHW